MANKLTHSLDDPAYHGFANRQVQKIIPVFNKLYIVANIYA